MTVARKGEVYLVGAGPGDPELLTLRALRLLQSADAVLHDDLVPDAVLSLAQSTALIVSVGKRCGRKKITQAQIHTLMIDCAKRGMSVVRLKSGDPLIFGRAAEEMNALEEAECTFEVVPGVTSALAAAAAMQVSLTDRHSSSAVLFSTAQHADTTGPTPCNRWDATQVVYMPGRRFDDLAAQWMREGAPAALPCAIVSNAAQPTQQVQRTTLRDLGTIVPQGSPTLLIAGWTMAAVADAPARLQRSWNGCEGPISCVAPPCTPRE